MNAAIKPKIQAEQELSTAANQLCLDNNVPSWKPQWKFTKETKIYVQDGKRGIN